MTPPPSIFDLVWLDLLHFMIQSCDLVSYMHHSCYGFMCITGSSCQANTVLLQSSMASSSYSICVPSSIMTLKLQKEGVCNGQPCHMSSKLPLMLGTEYSFYYSNFSTSFPSPGHLAASVYTLGCHLWP